MTWWQWHDEQPARRIGPPRQSRATSQLGHVRQWKARTYDVQLNFGAPPTLETAESPDMDSESDEAKNAAPDDGLRWKFAALLQPPSEMLLRENGPLEWPHALFNFQKRA